MQDHIITATCEGGELVFSGPTGPSVTMSLEVAEEMVRRIRVETRGDEPGIQHDATIRQLVAGLRALLRAAELAGQVDPDEALAAECGDVPPGYRVERSPEVTHDRWCAWRIAGDHRITVIPTTRERACQDAWGDHAINGGKP